MLYAISALHGYAIEASDGPVGTVRDLLFDDRTWRIRWLVVETGSWLTERRVLLHPAAVRRVDHDRSCLHVNLTKARVEGSLAVVQDLPVSRQMEHDLYGYYDWDPMWGGLSYFGLGTPPIAVVTPLFDEVTGGVRPHAGSGAPLDDGDPHLRSVAEISGYDLQAEDGNIGHVENLLFDDADWILHYLIVDTRNWWPGKHVLLSPFAVVKIDWSGSRIELDVTREQVRSGPAWDPVAVIDRAYEVGLHHHYGWRGYGW